MSVLHLNPPVINTILLEFFFSSDACRARLLRVTVIFSFRVRRCVYNHIYCRQTILRDVPQVFL